MNIRLGIYDIFSRIVPGGLYIAALVQLLSILGFMKFDLQTVDNLSLIASIGFLVIAYVLGGAFDNLAVRLYRLFKKPGFSERSFAEFKKKHAGRWSIDFGDKDWSLLLAFIRTKNLELAGDLDRHNASCIMLRNVSLGLLFLAINSVFQYFMMGSWTNILISLAMLVLSFLIMNEAVRFRTWFYDGIYETVLAYRIDLEDAIKPANTGKARSKA